MLEDVYMAFSVESGAFSPGLRQQVLHCHAVHKDGQGSPNMGGPSPLQDISSCHGRTTPSPTGVAVNTPRRERWSSMSAIGVMLCYDG